MPRGWIKLGHYWDEDDDSERWVIQFMDAQGQVMEQGVGFTRTAKAEPFTRERIDEVKAQHVAKIEAEGGRIL